MKKFEIVSFKVKCEKLKDIITSENDYKEPSPNEKTLLLTAKDKRIVKPIITANT